MSLLHTLTLEVLGKDGATTTGDSLLAVCLTVFGELDCLALVEAAELVSDDDGVGGFGDSIFGFVGNEGLEWTGGGEEEDPFSMTAGFLSREDRGGTFGLGSSIGAASEDTRIEHTHLDGTTTTTHTNTHWPVERYEN